MQINLFKKKYELEGKNFEWKPSYYSNWIEDEPLSQYSDKELATLPEIKQEDR